MSKPSPHCPEDPQQKKPYKQALDLQEKGMALVSHDRPAEAIPLLQQAIQAWPASPMSYRFLAEAQMESNRSADALTTLRALFYGWPGRDWSKDVLGWARDGNQQSNNMDTDPVLLLQFSLLLQQSQQMQEARAIYSRAFSCLPDYLGPLPEIDTAAATPSELQAATRTCLAAMDNVDGRTPSDPSWEEGPLREADKAIALQPNFAPAYFQRGRVLQTISERQSDALVAFTNAVQYATPAMKAAMKNQFQNQPGTIGALIRPMIGLPPAP